MYYLVCYEKETAVAIGNNQVGLKSFEKSYTSKIRRFLKVVGKNPVILIDQDYPSYKAVLENYRIIG